MEYTTAILGGLLIGLSSALLLLLAGRIAGISGLFFNAFNPRLDVFSASNRWRQLFIVGLILGTGLAHFFIQLPVPSVPEGGPILAVVAGLLVGVGTRLGGGCTSGHGICGLARLSTRSLISVITFMLSGVITVTIMRHII